MTQQQPIASASTIAAEENEPTRILLVEDDWLVARTIQQVLEGAGHGVVAWVGSAQEALIAAANLSPRLLLVDIQLPGSVDGVALVRMLREHQTIRVVFVTSHSDAGTLARVADVTPEDVLVKPFSQEQLLSAVSLALQTPNEARTAATAPADVTTSDLTTSIPVVRLDTADEDIHHLHRVSASSPGQATPGSTPPTDKTPARGSRVIHGERPRQTHRRAAEHRRPDGA